MINHNTYVLEEGYLKLLADTLNTGANVSDRTGTGTIAAFDAKLIIPAGAFPFSTVRSAALRQAFEEFWFFMRGDTQTKALEQKGVSFWVGNTSREFLDKRGLNYLNEGDMGLAYGAQWRGYNTMVAHKPSDIVDQLQETIDTLRNDPFSRRVYTTFWNPSASKYMALTPCWHSHQFVVLPDSNGNNVLHLKLINRSLDILFGCPFALQQYRLYQMCVAKMLGFKLGSMSCDLTQVHIYHNQVEYVKETLSRAYAFETDDSTYSADRIVIKKDLNTVEDMLELTWNDVEVDHPEVNKTPYKTPRPPMAA